MLKWLVVGALTLTPASADVILSPHLGIVSCTGGGTFTETPPHTWVLIEKLGSSGCSTEIGYSIPSKRLEGTITGVVLDLVRYSPGFHSQILNVYGIQGPFDFTTVTDGPLYGSMTLPALPMIGCPHGHLCHWGDWMMAYRSHAPTFMQLDAQAIPGEQFNIGFSASYPRNPDNGSTFVTGPQLILQGVQAAPTPEPSTAWMLGLGGLGLCGLRLWQRKQSSH